MMPSANVSESQITQKIHEINTHYQNYGIGGLAEAYEEFKREVAKAEAAAYKGEAGRLVLERIKDLENLFATVTGNEVKELSMFMRDSEALKRTAEFASINAENIRYGNLGGSLSSKEYTTAVKKYMNPDALMGPQDEADDQIANQEQANEAFNSFNWSRLGHWFYSRGNVAVPSYFLYGPLATQRRRLAPRTRNVDDTLHNRDKTTAQNVSASEVQDDPEQSTSHMVRTVYGVLNERDHTSKVNLFRFFINPHSFAQSVENLFYTSFLVRDGKVIVDVDDQNVPYVKIPDEDYEDVEEGSAISHHIATFDYEAWKTLIRQFNITEPYIPHRDVEEDTYSDSDG
ncbi:putative non-structural maintenance of chromosome element [Clavispora lusitaniae]|uniref:Non-structural maintenance of chromosomes element 4 n=2 Tax=Clavispora lusitaniae TaxID=36911 RepID=C4Y0N9_CLAL4|nr:uncharacterized protein CLUG_01771 [Clavispora lusitaniae ATCC 42720]QFZ26641.1 putative non-structural maintenance of chromosome element [Clavispora lusitaniae]EEQ37648.1 hypothetical protein CLUG_01771 [Clavispora lusitaniae ATCC 42720]QFZ32309.1 putative non-structural maintenance of chromosome element [Clavispora lusitaniae]QFZ37978.1 putative non-structural maintenance of chromosome element [Clavispora lusitaniae]QFZ43661.1 putative non-structural maintenance of chromosome element [Cla